MPLTELVVAVRDGGLAKQGVLAALAGLVADRVAPGIDRSRAGPLLDGTIPASELTQPVPIELLQPELLGDVLELLHDRDARRRQGAFFTPHVTAALVVETATHGWTWPERPRVCDPSCGGGAFLLAAGRALERLGLERDRIVDEMLWGVDADPLAVATTRAALAIWSGSAERDAPPPYVPVPHVPVPHVPVPHVPVPHVPVPHVPVPHVVVGDTLRTGLETWCPAAEPFDLVVGNPPFQSQLAVRTARTRKQAREMAERFGAASRAYADSSTLFLLAASSMSDPKRGRFALLLPESFLSARDAREARRVVTEDASIVGIWLPDEAIFSAAVRVCVPVFESGSNTSTVSRWVDADATATGSFDASENVDESTWAPLVADLRGLPAAHLPSTPVLSSVATATAGFRDQFYGLRPFVRDRRPRDDRPVRLLTSGSIDLVNDLSPRRFVKFAGTSFNEPVVEMERLRQEDPRLARWAERVLVPKVVVATQTRVVEVVVDEDGSVWPSVPVVAVAAVPERLWEIAAAIASPPISALGLRRHAGAALSGDAIKMSAKQVLDIPLPADLAAWRKGATHLHAASLAAAMGHGELWRDELHAFGAAMCGAYDASEEVLAWWLARLSAYR